MHSNDRPDGGAAYARSGYSGGRLEDAQAGMTRRQWLAGMAMQGLMSDATTPRETARQAWEQADAMLAEEAQ